MLNFQKVAMEATSMQVFHYNHVSRSHQTIRKIFEHGIPLADETPGFAVHSFRMQTYGHAIPCPNGKLAG